ncbi:MAG TPA: hypothetical protein VL225_04285 [Vicinamibacterales bacterium]|jgi:hypothetical protein|nr:hypothetical protein [Vicinamibacterales bacterium]
MNAARRPGDEHRSCYREILRLSSENCRLLEELARVRARHEDLIRSAEIWIRLYEAHLARAYRPTGRTTLGPLKG